MGNKIEQPGLNDPLTLVVTAVIFITLLATIVYFSKKR